MSEGDIAKKPAPEAKVVSTHDGASVQEQARSQLSLDADLAGNAKRSGDQGKTATDAVKPEEQGAERTPFKDLLKEMYGPQVLATAEKKGLKGNDLSFDPIPGYDGQPIKAALDGGAQRPVAGDTQLAHSDTSSIVKNQNGDISDKGVVDGQQFDITASKDKDSIVWKDKDGKEHKFERKKGSNSNEYTDGEGDTFTQNGDTNTIKYKNGFQVDIDARTGRAIIKNGNQEVAQFDGKDAVKRQIDDNNIAYQVRGDVGDTIQRFKDYQQRTGETQNGNVIFKNDKGDTVVLQQDGTEISRKADSATVTIKQGDTTVEYTPGQKPVIVSGGQNVTELNGGLQINGKEMVNKDGTVAISGMANGRLDSSHGRIYGTTDKGGAIDLGTGRAIADDLTTTNTGTGVKATSSDGQVIMETGADGKKIQTGPVTTNVDATNPTTTVNAGDGNTIAINNNDGSSRMIDAMGTDIASIDQRGNVDTWDGTHLGCDGDIWNAGMGLSGFTSYDGSGPSSFISREHSETESERAATETQAVAASSDQAVSTANADFANASGLANNVDASTGTLGLIDANIGNLAALRGQTQALLALNPGLINQLGDIDAAWAQLEGLKPVIQGQLTASDLLRTQFGVTSKDAVAQTAALGSSPQAADQVADYYQLSKTA